MTTGHSAGAIGTLHVSLLLDHSLAAPRIYGGVLLAYDAASGWAEAVPAAGLTPDMLAGALERALEPAPFVVAAVLADDEPLASPEIVAWCVRGGRAHVAPSPTPREAYKLQDELATLLGPGFGARCAQPETAAKLRAWGARRSGSHPARRPR